MNPFDPSDAFADFWKRGAEAALDAQGAATRGFADFMRAMSSASPTASVPAGDSPGLARANQAMAELWSASAGLSATLSANLADLAVPGSGEGGAAADTVLRTMLDPRTWLAGLGGTDAVPGQAADMVRLADLWGGADRRSARVAHAWTDLRRRGLEHNAVVLEAWLRAGRAFSEQAASRARDDGEPPGAKKLLAMWTETANGILQDMQRSEPFLQTQAATIRANTELLLSQRDLAEHYGKLYGLPTRTELDELHRTVTDLRRGMRTMRRELRSAQGGTPASPRQEDRERMSEGKNSKVEGSDPAIVGTEVSELQDGAGGPTTTAPTGDAPLPDLPDLPPGAPPPAAPPDAGAPRASRAARSKVKPGTKPGAKPGKGT